MKLASRMGVCVGAFVAALLVGACAVGPDYKKPRIGVQSGWSEGAATRLSATEPSMVEESAPPLAWWKTMRDPVLNSLVWRAWHENLDVKIAGERIREARSLRGEAVSAFYPSVNGDGTYGFFRQAGPLFPADTHDYQFYAVGFDAAWELDVFGRVRRSVEAAEDSLEAQIEAKRGALVSVVSEVARNYVELRTAQQRAAILGENIRTERESLELAQRLYAAGLAAELDVTRAAAQVTTTQSQLPILEIQQKSAIHQLGILLGESPSALVGELTFAGPVPAVPARVPIGLPSELLKRRPDVRQVERELAAATAEIGVAESELYPQFTLTGDLALAAVPPDINLFNWGNRSLGIGPGVRWELFEGGRILANVDAHKAIRQEVLDEYKLTILRAIGEVEDAMVAFARQQDQYDLLRQSVDSNQASVRISNERYSEGTVGFLSVLDAERSLLETQDALAVSRGDIDLSMIALYKAVGGGWEEIEVEGKR